MRKLYTTLLIMLLCVVSGYAQDTFEKDGLRYRITNSGDTPGEVWVTQSSDESDGYKGDITIPAEVLYDKTYKVTGIDSKAFKDCTDLTSVIIGNNVNNIDWQAFMNCEGLTSVTIPSSVTNISSEVFSNCTSLESITIPNSVTSLGGNVFSGCIKLTSVTLSDQLETIECYVFYGCERLESITIPNNVITIGYNAFDKCSKLTQVNLGDKLRTIQWNAFQNCESLESIVIPGTVTKIGDGNGCVFSGCTKLSSVNIPDGVKTIEGSTFSGCESLSSINIPSNVTKIEGNAFSGCKSLSSINIPSGVTKIEGGAFSGCKSLTSINIPDGIKKIEGGTFSDCEILKSVIIPDGVTSIGGSAFSGCKSLMSINIPDGVTKIEDNTFYGCESLSAISIPDDVTIIGGSAFSGCKSLTSIIIPNGVTKIEGSTFSGCESLSAINIPDGVTNIGEWAFSSCTSLPSIIIPSGVEAIGNYAFDNCPSLQLVISEIAEPFEVNAGWFSSEATLVAPEGKRAAYKGVNGWKDFAITLEKGDPIYDTKKTDDQGINYQLIQTDDYSSVYYSVKGHSDALKTEIVIPDALGGCPVKTIGGWAFNGTSLTSIIIPNSVTSIGSGAFQSCSSLTLITSEIAEPFDVDAFDGTTYDKATLVVPNGKINAYKEKNGWNNFTIIVEEGESVYANEQTDDQGLIYKLKLAADRSPYYSVKGHSEAIKSEIVIPESIGGCAVKAIEGGAFYNCRSLKSITIPGSVSINSNPFNDCVSLNDVIIIIKDFAEFCNNHILGGFDNPMGYYDNDSQTYITRYVNVHLKDSEGTEIIDYVIPEGVTAIGGNAFKGCTNLASVTIPSTVTSIGSYAFSNCTNFTSITIPGSVTSIGDYAFSECNGVKLVTSKISEPFEVVSWVFNGWQYNATLVVPEGKVNAYKEKSGWNGFAFIVEEGQATYDVPREQTDDQGLKYSLRQGDDSSIYYSVTGRSEDMKPEIVIPAALDGCPVRAIEWTFQNCASLTSITFLNDVKVENDAFYGCINLNDVNVYVWDDAEFCNNHILGGLNNPINYWDSDNQTSITKYFTLHILDNEGNEITDYVVPEGVTTIGKSAFKGYTSLASVTIPNSVTTIGDGAFYGCSNLNKVTSEISTPFDVKAFNFIATPADPLGVIDVPILIVPKGSRSAYKSKSGWEFAYTFEKGETIYDRNPSDKQGLKYTLNQANDGSFYYSVTGHSEDMNSEIVIPAEISGCPVKAIGSSYDMYNREGAAFYNCSDLTSVKLGKNVTSIGDYAFYNCSNLNSITLPKKLESIGNYAFSGDDTYRWSEGYKYVPITSVVIPGSVKTIGNGAFYGCRELVSISFEKVDEDEEGGLTSIGDEAFRSCSFPSITLPNSVKTIGWGAFVDNLLTTVTLGDAITEIKRETFYNCSDLASVTIPDGVTSIEERAFEGCGKLTSVKLPKSLTSMGENVFYRCPLTSIELPDAFTVIPANLFAKNNDLGYIKLGNNVQSIGKNAFGSKLSSDGGYYNEDDSEELIVIEIGTSTPPQIDKKAFPNVELSEINVIVPDQEAQTAYRSADVWGEMQLSNQNNYAELTVETPGNIGSELKSKCKMQPSKVVNLKVNGTINAKDFSQMRLNMNSLLRLDLSDCDITEIPNEALLGKAQLQELKLPTKLKTIGQKAFQGCTYLTGKLDLPSVTSIGESAFQGTNYTEVSLPRSLKTIGAYAFYNLPLEQRLEIPAGVTSIGDYAFADTHIHSRLELPDDVNLGAGAFRNTNISKLQLPRNIKSLSREAFQGCSNLEEADFSNTFTEVFDHAFDGCSSMTYVRLSANTTYLGDYAFRDTQLEYLNVPSKVEVIKQGLLKNCKNLSSLSLPANVQMLETEALSGCSGLRNMSVEAIMPPTVKKNAFRSINTDLCLISIPTQSIDDYGNADYWGRFVNMRNDIAVETEGNGEIAFESVVEGEDEGVAEARSRGQRIAAARAKTRASGDEDEDSQWTVANNGSSIFIPKNGKVRFFITPAVGETITSATLNGVDITNDIDVNGEYVATADKENAKLVVKFSDSGEAPEPGTATVAFEKAEYTVKMGETFTAPKATTTPEGLTLTYSSSDVTVATVDGKTGAVTLVATGTTNITALFAGNDDYKAAQASYKLTVKEASSEPEPQVDTNPVSIKISSAKQVTYMSDKNLDFTSFPNLKAYVATGYDKASGTIWLTRVKEVPANTGILLMGEAATYEVPAKTGDATSYYQNLFKGTIEGTTIYTTEGSNTNYYLSNGDAGVGFYKVTKEGGQTIGANRAYLSVPTEIPTVGSTGGIETIKVSAAGQVPYCNSQSLDFSSLDAQGVKAYTATGYDYSSGTIWLTRVKQVPAETGILIMAPQGEYPVPTASVASVYANMFKGTLTGTTIQTHETIAGEDYINYYLSNGVAGVGFYRVTKEDGVTIGANRCYLPILNKEAAGTRSASSGQSQITFQESDEVIGIRLMRGIGGDDDTTNLTPALSEGEGEGEWYTLQGQRVEKPGKGLYIRNGKKVIVK